MTNDAEKAERRAIDATLNFVNLRKVTDGAVVYSLFFDPAAPVIAIRLDEKHFQLLTPLPLAEDGAEAASILENDRAHAQVLLEAFFVKKSNAQRDRAEEIDALLKKGRLVADAKYEDRRLKQDLYFVSSGVEASYGYGLSLIYDRDREYGRRLRRCKLAECRNWFLSYARGGGGQLPRYCCEAHQVSADKTAAVARAKKWRERQPEKRMTRMKS